MTSPELPLPEEHQDLIYGGERPETADILAEGAKNHFDSHIEAIRETLGPDEEILFVVKDPFDKHAPEEEIPENELRIVQQGNRFAFNRLVKEHKKGIATTAAVTMIVVSAGGLIKLAYGTKKGKQSNS